VTEIQVITKAQTGDEDAFRQLVEMHQLKVYHLLLGMVQDEYEAQELTQITFVKAWHGLSRFRCDSSFWTWLYRIAYHSALDYLRGKKIRKVIFRDKERIPDKHGDPLESIIISDQKREILSTLQELPVHQRTAIVLYYFQGLSYEAIVEVTGRKLDTIRSDLHRGKAGLKLKLLRKWSEDDEQDRYG
jgi:RNA polymerase sigma-70 factor (ECF subfamily)